MQWNAQDKTLNPKHQRRMKGDAQMLKPKHHRCMEEIAQTLKPKFHRCKEQIAPQRIFGFAYCLCIFLSLFVLFCFVLFFLSFFFFLCTHPARSNTVAVVVEVMEIWNPSLGAAGRSYAVVPSDAATRLVLPAPGGDMARAGA